MPRRRGWLFALLLALGAAAATPEEVNDLAGLRIFGTSELWGEAPAAVLRRLNLNCRPEDLGGSQMFASPLRGDVFGCPASEIRIYAARDLVNKVDIILFNKGDNVTPGGGDKKKVAKRSSAFRKELRRHHTKMEKLLRDRLGRPRRAYLGSGIMSKQLPAWDCGEHVLMMDYSEGEYLQVHIVPGSAAAEHRSRVSGEERAGTKDSYAGRVRRSDNGDVFISGVPMVNQGQKGYCVPATVERVMRYFGVAGVDMHKLAERFDTGGGAVGVKYLQPIALHIDLIADIFQSPCSLFGQQGTGLLIAVNPVPDEIIGGMIPDLLDDSGHIVCQNHKG